MVSAIEQRDASKALSGGQQANLNPLGFQKRQKGSFEFRVGYAV
jgi:hypothetical protein